MTAITPSEMKIILNILQKHVRDCEVLAFGSRYKLTHTNTSDLDLAVKGKEKLPMSTISLLKEDFMESDIPYKVDVTDYHAVSDAFKEIINAGFELIYSEGSSPP